MDPEFIVYETSNVELCVDQSGRKVIENLEDGSQFVLERTIGKGSFSKVKLAVRHWEDEEGNQFQAQYAIKAMNKAILKRQRCVLYDSQNNMQMTNNLEKVMNEIFIWKQLCDKNIVRLYEVINDSKEDFIYCVMEYADLGQIMTWNLGDQKYDINLSIVAKLKEAHPQLFSKYSDTEASAKVIFSKVFEGVAYLHSSQKNIIHKDLKPDNILFSSFDMNIKITDFTISQQLNNPESLCFNPPGTTPFQSPESMFSGNGYSGHKSDIWAVGVCMYAYLNEGKLPFWDKESEIATQMSIQNQEPEYCFAEPLKELMKGILCKDPQQRLRLEDIQEHSWFKIV